MRYAMPRSLCAGYAEPMSSRFTRTREDFVCEHCGESVHGDGYTNHCPRCLWSKHVDVTPGDRAADCGALMRPVAVVTAGGRLVLVQQCTACDHTWRNRVADQDDQDLLHTLVAVPLPAQGQPTQRRRRRAG